VVRDRGTLVAAGTALIAAVTLAGLPWSAGLGLAMVVGTVAGDVAGRRRQVAS
jgi:lauroyl/myristoyl acyltransferase